MRLLSLSILVTAGLSVSAQMPTQIAVLTADAQINHVAVADFDNDGSASIFTVGEEDNIFRYRADGSDYVKEIFFEVASPLFMGIADINRDGGPDVYFTAADKRGLTSINGESDSPYDIPFKSELFDDILPPNIVEANFVSPSGFGDNALILKDGNDSLHIVKTGAGSFTYPYGFYDQGTAIPKSGQISSFFYDENYYIFLSDQDNSNLSFYRLKDGFNEEISPIISFVESISNPSGVAIAKDRAALGEVIYVSSDNGISRFYRNVGMSLSESIDSEITDVDRIYMRDINNDGAEELLAIVGNKLFAYQDLPQRLNKVLIYEGEKNLKETIFGYVNQDSILDIVILEEESNQVAVLSVSTVLNDEDLDIADQLSITPNPTSDMLQVVDYEGPYVITDMVGKIIKSGTVRLNQAINVSNLKAATYTLQCGRTSQLFVKIN